VRSEMSEARAIEPDRMGEDALIINVSYGYDIGIGRASKSQRQQHSPKEWQELLSRLSEKTEI